MDRSVCFCTSIPAGDTARGPRSTKDVSSTSGADIWDANHDGIYTCDEWKSCLDRLFTLADRNRDGHLDPSEFTIIRQAGTSFTDADFAYFDENQDGKITRSEFVDNWKGFLRLSLVTCPIAAPSDSEKVSFNQMNKNTGHRIKYAKVDAETGEEVSNDDIIKGATR
jgi:Ca2+-binding EF-hand superfamily protein